MNAADLLAIADVNALRAAASRAWEAGNNAGDGFDPVLYDYGDLVLLMDSDDQVSIWLDSDDVILIGDANGAWAVRVGA